MQNKIAIVGMGYVGNGMLKIFPDAVQYDEPRGLGAREEVNSCDLAVVSVPTNTTEGGELDMSIVEEVVSWIETPVILIKSALNPGTTEKLKEKYKKRIVVSPEYMGEGKYWTPPQYPDPQNPLTHGFMILGGEFEDCSYVADIFTPKVGPATRFRFMPALEAEIVKLAENFWGQTKVTLANELRDICEAVSANWHLVREGWIDDPRVEPMHTAVFKNARGFGGKCFPKDGKALVAFAKKFGVSPILMQAVIKSNESRNV